MRNKPSKLIRMWHKKENDWCHAWDVDEAAYRRWKDGYGPLSAFHVFLPKGGHPAVPSQVVCGTCGSRNVIPKEMKQEPL